MADANSVPAAASSVVKVGRSRVSDWRSQPDAQLGALSSVQTAFADSGRTQRFQVKSADGTSLITMLGVNNLEGKQRITRPYEENGWVHACVKAKGQAVASLGAPQIWVGEPGVDKSARLLEASDRLVRLMRRPLPMMTASQFYEAGVHHRILDGEDLWVFLDEAMRPTPARPGGKLAIPRYIMPVRGQWVSLLTDAATGWPSAYSIQTIGGRSLEVPLGSAILFRDYNLDDPLRGLGDVEALVSDIDLEWQATRYQRSVLKNSGDPGGFIITETALAPEEADAAENEAKQQFGPSQAGEWKMLTGKGIRYQPNNITPKDMQFQTLHPWSRDKICGVLGVPPPIIGVLDNATLNNFQQSMIAFWSGGNGILPYTKTVEDVIDNLFLRDLDHPNAGNLFARFDTSRVKALQEDRGLQLKIAAEIRERLLLSPAEALAIVGLPSDKLTLAYGSEHVIPSGQTTVDATLDLAESQSEPDMESEPAEDPASDTEEDPASDGEEDQADKSTPVETRESASEDPSPEQIEAEKSAARRAYWKTKEASVLRGGEAAVRRAYRKFRKLYERAQFKRIRDFAAEGDAALRDAEIVTKGPADDGFSLSDLAKLLLNREEWAQRMLTWMRPPLIEVSASALSDLADELELEFPMSASDPAVIAALDAQTIKLVEGHTSYLAERVREALSEGLSKATNQGNLQAAVEEVLTELEAELANKFQDRTARALTISRTETAKAANTVRFLEMQHSGITQHTWVSSHDAAVRGTPGGPYEDAEFSHYSLDGKDATIGFEFDNAKHPGLKFPGDPDADPGDSINCRCVAQPVRPTQNED